MMTTGNRRGQALLELAIFGMAALAALGFLIRVGMQMNYDQEARMMAFRRALAAARADNSTPQDAMAVAYHTIADRQMPSPTDGFMSLPRSRTQASAFVEWGDRLTFAYENPNNPSAPGGRKTQPRVVVNANGNERSFRQNDFPEHDITSGGFAGIVTQQAVHNNTNATLHQDEHGTSLSSGTASPSTTYVNTRTGETSIPSGASGGGSWPP